MSCSEKGRLNMWQPRVDLGHQTGWPPQPCAGIPREWAGPWSVGRPSLIPAMPAATTSNFLVSQSGLGRKPDPWEFLDNQGRGDQKDGMRLSAYGCKAQSHYL